jgi:DNA-directed DNA polymerase III PolC
MSEELSNQNILQLITTDESYHEGLDRVGEYIDVAKAKGITSLALIDRNALGMVVPFYKKCIKNEIKPIIGTKLRLDFPEVDYKDAVLNNLDALTSAKSLLLNNKDFIFKLLGINVYSSFSEENNFELFNEFKLIIDKNDKSKSKTKSFVLMREITRFFKEVSLQETYNKNSEIGLLNPVELYYQEELFKASGKDAVANRHQKFLEVSYRNQLKSVISNEKMDKSLSDQIKKKIDKISFFTKDGDFLGIFNDDIPSTDFSELLSLHDSFDLVKEELLDSVKYYGESYMLGLNITESTYPLRLKDFTSFIKKINTNISYGDIIAIALNDEGYQNIKELITLSFKTGQKKIHVKDNKRPLDSFPLSSISDLEKFKKGIMFISMNDKQDIIAKNILNHGKDGVVVAKLLQKKLENNLLFAIKKSIINEPDSYHLEESVMMDGLLSLSEELDIPTIATHDVRFAKEESYSAFDLRKAILLNEVAYDPSREKTVFTGQYLKTKSEIKKSFIEYPELIENNEILLSEIDAKVRLDYYVLPDFDVPEDFEKGVLEKHFKELGLTFDSAKSNIQSKQILKEFYFDDIKLAHPIYYEEEVHKKITNIVSGEYMNYVAWEGIVDKLKIDYGDTWEEHKDAYHERFEYESNIINDMGFPGYFLIVYDFIRYAKKEADVPVGPGRGSGAGSLIAYGLDITDVDPIPTNLFFERFLNPERVSMPDFDIDFSQEGRALIIKYVKDKYGEVAQIATQGRLKPKSVLRGICKALGHTVTYEDDIMNYVADNPDLKLNDLKESQEFIEKMDSEIGLSDKMLIAEKLINTKTNAGLHAAGVVISPTTLTAHAPVQRLPNGEGQFVQSDKNDIESQGLVKFDFLGLKTLDVIKEAIRQAERNYNKKIDIRTIDKQDEKTFALLKIAKTHGIFQLESGGMTALVKKLQVENIEEMSALVALYRPGPMQSGMMASFVDRKNGTEDLEYMHPKLTEALSYTYGTMIYQEQVMQAAQLLAGYTLGGADELRRAMGKKKVEEMIKHKASFNNGSLEHNLDDVLLESESIYGEKVDIKLLDLLDTTLNLKKYTSKEGFFATEDLVKEFLLNELSFSDTEVELLFSKINNKDFKVEQMYPNYKEILPESKWDTEFSSICYKLRNTLKIKLNNNEVDANRIYHGFTQFARYNSIFFKIEQFAAYGFNKAHSYAYAVIAYQTAYLKAHNPKEFFAAHCSFHSDGADRSMQDKVNETVEDMEKNFEIPLLPPSVNKSFYRFNAEKEGVRYGLRCLKGLGDTGLTIEKERIENGDFISLHDFIFRMDYRNHLEHAKNTKLSKRSIEALLYSGSLDEFIPDAFPSGKKMGRNYLLKEFNLLSDTKVYPKDDVMKIVDERFKKGNYEEDLIMTVNPLFNPLQDIICKSIAYIKTPEDLFYNEEEKKAFKEQLSEEKKTLTATHKGLTSDIKSLEKTFTGDDLKIFKKSNTLTKKLYIKGDGFEESIQLISDIEAESNVEELLNSLLSVVSKYKKETLDKDEYPEILRVFILKNELDIIKKANLINSLPDGLRELPVLFSEKNKNEKVKSIVKFIKANNPDQLKVISNKIKESVSIENKTLCELEKETTGLYLTGHPVDINNANKRFNLERESTNISFIIDKSSVEDTVHEVNDGYFNILGVINNIEVKKIKTGDNAGKDWVSFNIQDKTGTLQIRMFSELFNKTKDYISDGNVIALSIQASVDDEWGLQCSAKELKSYLPDMKDDPFIQTPYKAKKSTKKYV